MNIAGTLSRPLYWLAGKIFSIWARPAVQPDDPRGMLDPAEGEIVYVLETGGLADLLALERVCARKGLPSPTESFVYGGIRENRRVVVLRHKQGFFARRSAGRSSPRLRRLVDASLTTGDPLQLVPVAIYWGRSPDKERSTFKLLFSENWEVAGRTRKFFATILVGRDTLLRYSEALPLRSVINEGDEPAVLFRKVSRILRVHLRQRRTATVGPDLSHKRTLVNQVLRAPGVQRVIEAEAGDDRDARMLAEKKAREYALEIAADISYPTIRIVERLLKRVWHQIYDGIELNHVDQLQEVAEGQEVVYVPCHRSHFDYLLLGYVVYEEGLHIPHVAAGINLNLPVVGSILRRGGAFFLRRTFKGNKLYAAVFDAYLHQVIRRGHSMEYFIEGGRSRTGRLLEPKGGMLVMTVHSFVKDPRRPIVFVPVYFGYERLIEGDAFISELGGAAKEKESLFGLIRSLRSLREHYGKVYVNFARPIELEPMLDELHPDWRHADQDADERPEWLGDVVDALGGRIMQEINSAAAVTPISLLAYVLLATPKQKIGADELVRQLRLSLDLLKRFRYSELVTIPKVSPEAIIEHGQKLGVIYRTTLATGDVWSMTEDTAVRMTYFRNNIMHLLAIPAAVASCFIQGRELEHAELQRLVRMIYPFIRKELCLKWDFRHIDDVTSEAIEALVEQELLTRSRNKKMLIRPPAGSEKAYQLLMLGNTMVPMLQRFYLAIAILVRNGSGALTRTRLEQLCQQSAERLSMIYGLHSPDFFNKTLFHDFIKMLSTLNVVRRNQDGLLEFDESIQNIGADARLVLGEEIRHSILSLTVVDKEMKSEE
ncbi:MAG: glycerol-3-phosphate 1-O-acyltransferase PlsB [Woeseiaceae bacterium]|jgi:glycerol-3-phosphate O-acyltransferase|nr:glycerol-3-phosphate 1-O-acyltransferase PlsB [Woeseiaceae bacterium]